MCSTDKIIVLLFTLNENRNVSTELQRNNEKMRSLLIFFHFQTVNFEKSSNKI